MTEMPDAIYPLYRRRDNGRVAHKGNAVLDNRDVIPYNPYLSRRFQCHLNVEVVSSIRAVKYLFKYSYKGHDRATIEFGIDEVKEFLDTRYVGPPEACWRIFEFDMMGRSHSVVRLPVHLPNQQGVSWEQGDELQEVVAKASTSFTMLTACLLYTSPSPRDRG